MARVDLFALDNELFLDTRIPFQNRGGGKSAAARAFQLSALLQFIQDNIQIGPVTATVTTGAPSVAVTASKLVEKIVVIGSGSGVFKLGTTPGGSEILDGESYSPTAQTFSFNHFFQSAGSLYFSGFTGTLTVFIYTR